MKTDILIAGSGCSGLYCALQSQGAREIINRAQKRANGKNNQIWAAVTSPAVLGSPAPMAWPNNTVTPMVL